MLIIGHTEVVPTSSKMEVMAIVDLPFLNIFKVDIFRRAYYISRRLTKSATFIYYDDNVIALTILIYSTLTLQYCH